MSEALLLTLMAAMMGLGVGIGMASHKDAASDHSKPKNHKK